MKIFFINTFFSCLILIGCKNSASNERIFIQAKDTLKNKSDSFVKKINFFFEPVVDSNFLVEKAQDYLLNRDDISYDLDEDNPEGIFSFRGGNLRNSPVRGTIDFVPKKVVKSWEFKTSMDSMNGKWGRWGGGAGWTGQPLVINWNEQELKNISTLKAEFKERKNLKEIVQVSLCGKVYFLDFETGKSTREPISIDNPIKGTPSIDSKKKNFLLLGQGIPHRGGFAWRCFNLKTNKLIHEEKMPDKFAFRKWGACDASPLIEPNSKTFVWPTESGVIYYGSLSENKLDSIEKYRYKSKETSHQGIESSPSAIGNLIYFTDNGGNVFCLDVKTMKPRWHYFNNDDSDATPAIQMKDGVPYIFIGNEVDKQGGEGIGALRKLNGLTGKVEWQFEKKCFSRSEPKTNNGGMLSTPCIGKEKAENLVWTIFSLTTKNGGGLFVCLDINTGQLKYEIPMENYSWVSPIAVYDNDGKPYVYFPDVGGNIYLVEGITGKMIYKESLGHIFESSPVAWGNRIIQPARGNKIFSFLIQ